MAPRTLLLKALLAGAVGAGADVGASFGKPAAVRPSGGRAPEAFLSSTAGSSAAQSGTDVDMGLESNSAARRSLNIANAWTVLNINSSAWGGDGGRYAYFDDSTFPGFVWGTAETTKTVEQYRNGAKIWTGPGVMWHSTDYIMGTCQPSACTSMLRRSIGHAGGQWNEGDLIYIPGFHDSNPVITTKAPASTESEDSGTGIILGILGAFIGVIICGLVAFLIYKHQEALDLSNKSRKQAPEEPVVQQSPPPVTVAPVASEGKPKPHLELYASRWCVTPEQFFAFINEVYRLFPTRDPTIEEVVEMHIKLATKQAGTSYALFMNPEGVPVKHFVTYTWSAGVKQLGQAVFDANPSGGIWIDFLSMPQTITRAEQEELMTPDLWKSPTTIAMNMAKDVIAVRNQNVSLYTRLWCVFELYLADTSDKPVSVVGFEGDLPESTSAVGLNGTCTKPEDVQMLLKALEPQAEQVNAWLNRKGISTNGGASNPSAI